MPTSPYAHIEFFGYLLASLKPKSILDVGVGNGKLGFIARDVLDVMFNESYKKEDWKIIIDGIERFEPYIQAHQKYIYNNIYIGDAYEVIDTLGIYDVIIIGDVIEHFQKEKGWLLLDKCALHCKYGIILNLPLGETTQGAIYDNEYERHLSSWYEEEFENIHEAKKLYVFPNNMNYGVFLINRNKLLNERIKNLALKAIDMNLKGQVDGAIDTFRYINKLNPEIYDNHIALGVLLAQKGNYNEAVNHLQIALKIKPDSSIAHYNLAKAYKDSGDYTSAINHYIQALTLNPLDVEALYNLGNTFAHLDRYDEAIVAYETALTINPKHINSLNNLGAVRHILCQLDDAIGCYDKIIEIDPTNADAHYNKSLSLLLKGDFKQGWRLYEWRFKREDYPPRTYQMMLWDGKTFRGNLLLYAEQGLGDTIHFVRYLKLLNQMGLDVYLHCHNELVSLIKNGVEGICDVIPFTKNPPSCDFYFPLMSLPMIFKTNLDSIPSEVPYIHASEIFVEKWKRIVGNEKNLKVGIVWSGNPNYKNEKMRSLNLNKLEPLFDIKGITFYSIQKGPSAKETSRFEFIKDYTDEILDFSDTAGMIANLDLIISVDTSVAHLAGAMAKPVWILLPFSPDWRWLLNRDDSPWYKTARLFRQKKLGDWDEVIFRVKVEIERLIHS